jgi:hypothetical protein
MSSTHLNRHTYHKGDTITIMAETSHTGDVAKNVEPVKVVSDS